MWVSAPQVNVSSPEQIRILSHICHVPTLIFCSLIILDHGHLIPKHHVLIGRRDLLFPPTVIGQTAPRPSLRICICCAIYKSKQIVDFFVVLFQTQTGMSVRRTRIFLAGLFGPSSNLSSANRKCLMTFAYLAESNNHVFFCTELLRLTKSSSHWLPCIFTYTHVSYTYISWVFWSEWMIVKCITYCKSPLPLQVFMQLSSYWPVNFLSSLKRSENKAELHLRVLTVNKHRRISLLVLQPMLWCCGSLQAETDVLSWRNLTAFIS